MGAHEIHGTGTLRHSEGGALTGKHLETYEQENREGLEIQQEIGSKEKSVGGGWREQRQWLIHEWSHVLNFLKQLSGMSGGGGQCTGVSSGWVYLSVTQHRGHLHRTWENRKLCTSGSQ